MDRPVCSCAPLTLFQFNYWHDSSQLWSIENMRNGIFNETEYADDEEDLRSVDIDELMNYPSPTNGLYASVEDISGKSEVPAINKMSVPFA